jgi:predicted SAM-dependent methyltransferase
MTFVRNLLLRIYLAMPVQHAVLALLRLSGRERRWVSRYLARPGFKAVQIGAGANRHEGWLHTNWFPIRPWGRQSIFLDVTRRFPFPDASLDYVFSEHMIEHVPYAGGLAMLRECMRVLKPGGRVRISTPDLRLTCSLLSGDLSPLQRAYVEWTAQHDVDPGDPPRAMAVINKTMRGWGHQFIYDEETLRESMERAGLIGITRYPVSESADPVLVGIDNAARRPEGFLNLESVVLEAARPI